MQERYRFWSTVVVWVAFTFTVLVTILSPILFNVPAGFIIPIAVGLMFVAGISTYGIWQSAGPQAAGQQTEKAKRANRERIERLVESLDEDEVVELESLLLAREAAREDDLMR